MEIPNGPVLKESNGVEKGMAVLPPFQTPIGRLGMTICFDVSLHQDPPSSSLSPTNY